MNAILQNGTQPQADRRQLWGRIPAEMRERPQWCISPGLVEDKAPRSAAGHLASSTSPSTWSSFDVACAAAAERGWHVGYVLHDTDAFACIDLDVKNEATHPDKPDKWTSPEELERQDAIVTTMASYTERSRSGLGRHVWVRAEVGPGCKRDGVELYSRERFIICTGDVVCDLPVEDRQDLVSNMASRMRPQVVIDAELRPDDPGADQGHCIAALALEDAGEMGRLMRRNWEGTNEEGQRRYGSQSEADFKLMLMLGRLTESNGACREAFQLSMLGRRAKADIRYLNLTLRKVRGY
jgi:primase-polymerase (primpol)-like protein